MTQPTGSTQNFRQLLAKLNEDVELVSELDLATMQQLVVNWTIAFCLDPDDDDDELITRAFQDANLDPKVPHHWAELVRQFAEAKYRSKAGAPTKWTTVRSLELLEDLHRLKCKNPGHPEKDLHIKLIREYPKTYNTADNSRSTQQACRTLKRRISEARKIVVEYLHNLPVVWNEDRIPDLSEEQEREIVKEILAAYR